MSKHPSYPNPTLQEALCEVQFTPATEMKWLPNRPEPLIDRFKNDYHNLETIMEQGMTFTVGGPAPGLPQFQLRLKIRLRHKSLPLLLQFGEASFSINAVERYDGWEALKRELLAVWPKAAEVIAPSAIVRVGMRYINRVRRRSGTETASAWLRSSPFLPDKLLESGPGSTNRFELHYDKHHRVITTIAQDDSTPEPHGSLIFDVDRIVEREMSTSKDELAEVTETLHEDIWTIFAGAKNGQYEKLLKGELGE